MHGKFTPTTDEAKANSKAVAEALDQEVDALSWMTGAEYDLTRKEVGQKFSVNLNTLDKMVRTARKKRNAADARAKADADGRALSVDDFVANMSLHNYIYLPTREPWPAASVNARVPSIEENGTDVVASEWLDRNKPVEQMTWMPGEPELIRGLHYVDGGRVFKKGATTLNLYKPPLCVPEPGDVTPWVNLVQFAYPDDADHIIKFLAQRVQQPAIKINHALVLGGSPGIGKDTILEPIKQAVGPWNFATIKPAQLLDRWTYFLRSAVLLISEAHDLGDINRYAFYERSKLYAAAPPSDLPIEEKHLRQYYIPNLCGVVITTNNKTSGLYLPPDDRRHYVAWSPRPPSPRPEKYWVALYAWYEAGGAENVAHYLQTLDISDFNPKAPPPKTDAFWEVVHASANPDDVEMASALDRLENKEAIVLSDLAGCAIGRDLAERANRSKVPKRMEACGYVQVPNPDAADKLWKFTTGRQAIYAKSDMTPADRLRAARALQEARKPKEK
ncbi:primase-helicase family protein [Mesorhizobium sp.]|uniref:primase-helicase family protein n=1 Tax=Mesorhizobium sp. TaxID=1871066 RepID=UPI0012113843|nr:primase-helicase family protein [Mesorhizobium sp.]TIQ46734.1 MAG: hypothetical protein E5X47_23355 [Mesorhizobium sp.]TIQ56507.1 MAG: hypothetical protein E5X46_18720 [Mesorhizobium sp.]